MGMIRRLIALLVLMCGAALAGVAAYTYLYQRPAALPDGANIVVLSAGLAGAEMDAQTAERTATGIALYQQLIAEGQTPILVMTGGRDADDPASRATLMADAAREAGIPISDLRVEVEAKSTLQNALFSRDVLGPEAAAPVIVVTHRYHLPRAWASFRWAGLSDLTLYSAEPPEAEPIIDGLIMEGIKWPANLIRAGIYSGLTAAGMNGETLAPLLQ